MSIHPLISVSLASLTLLVSSCADTEDEFLEPSDRNVYFDGADIEAVLQEDPSTTFFADVRNGITNHFDQSEEPIDFSRFYFQSETITEPVPMKEFLSAFETEFYIEEYWSIQATEPNSEAGSGFRYACWAPEPNCWCECPDPARPFDCHKICT